jgi:hypothetical protein
VFKEKVGWLSPASIGWCALLNVIAALADRVRHARGRSPEVKKHEADRAA